MPTIKEVAIDLTNFVLSNVNEAISFKPQLCYQVPAQDYAELRERYIAFTGTSMRKNKSKLYFLPTNISDELQQLNTSIPESAKEFPTDGHVYYKNRLITELDYENVKRVELACAYIAYATVNKAVNVEMHDTGHDDSDDDMDPEKLSPAESATLALRRGGVIGFRELGYLVSITPWHFHRVFKVITGLTIREYGQLCCEFIKKNRDIMNACKKKVEELKALGHSYHCFDDPDFLKEGTLSYEPTENVVLLPEYFIDPNKSKEHKKKQKEAKNSDGKCTQRVEARKRRSSVMSGRIRRASQSSICSNSSIQDALHNEVSFPTTPQMTSSAEQSDYSDQSESASPMMNLGLTHSRSRKGSVVSGIAGFPQQSTNIPAGKVTKRRGTAHMRNVSDPVINKNLRSLPLEQNLTAQNVMISPLVSPKVDFKYNMFSSGDMRPGTHSARQDSGDMGFPLDFGSSVPPHVLDPQDSGVYAMGMQNEPVPTTSSSGDSLPSAPFTMSINDAAMFNQNVLPNANDADGSTLVGGMGVVPDDELSQAYRLYGTTQILDEGKALESAGTSVSTVNTMISNAAGESAGKYSRNRVNSVIPEPEEFDRMFLSGFMSSNPSFQASSLGGDLPTRDDTMITSLTSLSGTDVAEATLQPEAKNVMPFMFDGNLGTNTLSPVCSPTTLDSGLPLYLPNTSLEALIASGGAQPQDGTTLNQHP
ncbi:LAFE_0F09054g1_1 [Lachancea fermentati]|uniref:LAFE_0F09054g1_1 n=1 Tax=Lachancea fermentati TaxID=4955 RepID=A0A1G4MF54_LACFM|nr:LAFE_0F09054g1_1 [Lachancea fermentati]